MGLQEDLTPSLHQPAIEVDVVHEVPGTRQGRPVRGCSRMQHSGRVRHGVGVLRAADPGGAQAGHEGPGRGLQGRRATGVAPVPVGGEHRVPAPYGQQQLDAVVQLERRRAYRPVHGRGGAPEPAAQPLSGPQSAVGAVGAQPEQCVPQPCPPGHGGARRAVAAAVRAGPPEELDPGPARQPVPGGEEGREVVEHPPEHHRSPDGEFGARVDEGEDPVVLVEDVEVPPGRGGEDVAAAPLPVADADGVQHGDRPGGHQHRVGPGGVLVVARREGEPARLDELAPVRLVPDDHQDLEQFGPVGEPEGGRSGLGQVLGEGVAHTLARPVGPRVVVDQDVGAAGGLQTVGDGLERLGGEGVVGVEEEQVVPGRPGHPGVAGGAEAGVARQVDGADPGVAYGVLVGDRAAGVR